MPSKEHNKDRHISRNLGISFFVTSAVFLVELIGWMLSNSLALFSDAGHVFMDIFAIGMSIYVIHLAKKRRDNTITYGLHRFEILASFVNGITLIGLTTIIFFEGYSRLFNPQPVMATEMIIVAVIGLAANVYVAMKLHGYNNLNVRAAYIHVLGDTLSSIAVLVGGLIIALTGNYLIDSMLSFLIAIVILFSAISLIRDSIRILLEGIPKNVDINLLKRDLIRIKGVKEVHDVHVWNLCSDIRLMSVHILANNIRLDSQQKLIKTINSMLKRKYKITHTTIQFELTNCGGGQEIHYP